MSLSGSHPRAGETPVAPLLRRRTDADWAALLDLWVASWRATYPEIDFDARREWLVRQITTLEAKGAATLCLFTAEAGALAGFVIIDPASGWLDQICVGPEYIGGGYGETLMKEARSLAPGIIRLDVNADNDRAVRFYERGGFRQIGRGANTLSGRETIMMEWRSAD